MNIIVRPITARLPNRARIYEIVPELENADECCELPEPVNAAAENMLHGDLVFVGGTSERNFGLMIYDKDKKKVVPFGCLRHRGSEADDRGSEADDRGSEADDRGSEADDDADKVEVDHDYTVPPQFNAIDGPRFHPLYWFSPSIGTPLTDALSWCAFIYYDFTPYLSGAVLNEEVSEDETCTTIVSHPRCQIVIHGYDGNTFNPSIRVFRVTPDHLVIPDNSTTIHLYI